MTNEFEKVVEDVGKAIAYPFVHTAQFTELAVDAFKDYPAVKAAVLGLVKAGEVVVADVATDISAKGLNLPEDQKTLTDIKAYKDYFTGTFVPAVESAYKDLKSAE